MHNGGHLEVDMFADLRALDYETLDKSYENRTDNIPSTIPN